VQASAAWSQLLLLLLGGGVAHHPPAQSRGVDPPRRHHCYWTSRPRTRSIRCRPARLSEHARRSLAARAVHRHHRRPRQQLERRHIGGEGPRRSRQHRRSRWWRRPPPWTTLCPSENAKALQETRALLRCGHKCCPRACGPAGGAHGGSGGMWHVEHGKCSCWDGICWELAMNTSRSIQRPAGLLCLCAGRSRPCML
jgi:hypothetical protein